MIRLSLQRFAARFLVIESPKCPSDRNRPTSRRSAFTLVELLVVDTQYIHQLVDRIRLDFQASFADGSVRVVDYEVDPKVYRAMGSRNGRETVVE